jgi:hypothetical protein
MTFETGLPDAQPSRPARHRIFVCGAVVVGCIMTCTIAQPQPDFPPGGPSLDRPIALIRNAFRTGKPEPLTSLLPGEGRAFLSLGSVGGTAGYYSRDQIYFILAAVFARRETVDFTIRPQKPAESPTDGNAPRQMSRPVYCISIWSYHGHDGINGETQIHFVLQLKNGAWSLVEILEAQ